MSFGAFVGGCWGRKRIRFILYYRSESDLNALKKIRNCRRRIRFQQLLILLYYLVYGSFVSSWVWILAGDKTSYPRSQNCPKPPQIFFGGISLSDSKSGLMRKRKAARSSNLKRVLSENTQRNSIYYRELIIRNFMRARTLCWRNKGTAMYLRRLKCMRFHPSWKRLIIRDGEFKFVKMCQPEYEIIDTNSCDLYVR